MQCSKLVYKTSDEPVLSPLEREGCISLDRIGIGTVTCEAKTRMDLQNSRWMCQQMSRRRISQVCAGDQMSKDGLQSAGWRWLTY
jgi:hypothetical protein